MDELIVTRHESPEGFLAASEQLLMLAEAENNLMLGIAQGLVRNPQPERSIYLATVGSRTGIHACAVHIAPFKLVVTRADRKAITALAKDAHAAIPNLEGVTGPASSSSDFAVAWSQLSGTEPVLAMRLRIYETRKVVEDDLPKPRGIFRPAGLADLDRLTAWTKDFVREAKIADRVDAAQIVADSINRGRLHVWEDGEPVSMAAWTGKTPNGVRINFVYTPRDQRGKGYATACVSALTKQQLEQGCEFCWLYTDLSSTASPKIFKRIGYWPVSDVAEYYLKR